MSRNTEPKKILKMLLLQASLAAGTLFCIDIASFFFLPAHLAANLHEYRVSAQAPSAIGGRERYPKDYFVSHPTRGMDIGANHRAVHELETLRYPIWSNRFGCFDRDWPAVPTGYAYFAGDSFTWGYAAFEEKFATIFEAKTGKPALKCGVTHTGQRHQFDKFREVVKLVGHFPSRVIVGYFVNDIANDYAHPHSTVVDGWQVDDVYLDINMDKVHVDQSWISQQIAASLAAPPPPSMASQFIQVARRYSLTMQMLSMLTRDIRRNISQAIKPGAVNTRVYLYKNQEIRWIYSLLETYFDPGPLKFQGNHYADPNRTALLDWKRHSLENKYELSILLIPDKDHWGKSSLYQEVRSFLKENNIDYLDLTEVALLQQIKAEEVYWRTDGHFSPAGNHLVAEELIKRWGAR